MQQKFDRLSNALAKILKISSEELLNSFKPATESEIDEIMAFRRLYLTPGPRWHDLNYLRWRYTFSDESTDSHGRFWLLKVNGEILGAVGVEKFNLLLDGEAVEAFHPLDLMTKPDLKGIGIGAWLNLALMRMLPILFVMGSSEEADRLIRKIYHPMPDCTSWKLPIKIYGSLKRKFYVPGLTYLLATLWDSYSWALREAKLKRSLLKDANVRKIDRFDEEVDKLSCNFTLAGVFRHRTSRYLNWRFLDNPCTDYTALGLYANDGTMLAYSISHLVVSPKDKQKSLLIDDIFWLSEGNNEMQRARAMLLATINHGIKHEAKMVNIDIYSNELAGLIESAGFFFRGNSCLIAIWAAELAIAEKLQDDKAWFITEGDAHNEDYHRDANLESTDLKC